MFVDQRSTETLSEDQRISRRLLPMAKGMIVALAIFFFIASLAQLAYLHLRIQNVPSLNLKESIQKRSRLAPGCDSSAQNLKA